MPYWFLIIVAVTAAGNVAPTNFKQRSMTDELQCARAARSFNSLDFATDNGLRAICVPLKGEK